MKITGITTEQAYEAIRAANTIMQELDYDGREYGLIFNRAPEGFGKRITGANCTLKTLTSDVPAARTAASGRRGRYASYEAHYTFMEAVFAINPDARIQSAMADYRGYDEFLDKAPAVANRNVGSMAAPAAYGSL